MAPITGVVNPIRVYSKMINDIAENKRTTAFLCN